MKILFNVIFFFLGMLALALCFSAYDHISNRYFPEDDPICFEKDVPPPEIYAQ